MNNPIFDLSTKYLDMIGPMWPPDMKITPMCIAARNRAMEDEQHYNDNMMSLGNLMESVNRYYKVVLDEIKKYREVQCLKSQST